MKTQTKISVLLLLCSFFLAGNLSKAGENLVFSDLISRFSILQEWMTDRQHFAGSPSRLDEDTDKVLENWMLDLDYFDLSVFENEKSDQLMIEKWMSNPLYFHLPCTTPLKQYGDVPHLCSIRPAFMLALK